MWVWLKLKPTPKGEKTQTDIRARVCRVLFQTLDFCAFSVKAFFLISLCKALSDTGMGKYGDFPFEVSVVRPKSAMYTPKRDDEHPRHFYMGIPLG